MLDAAAPPAPAASRDLVGLPEGLVICCNPECYRICPVTPSRRAGSAYCSRACQRRVTYLMKRNAGRCVQCHEPAVAGGVACDYHTRRARLRDAMHSWRHRPAGPERDAALAQLRVEYDALAVARAAAKAAQP